MAEIVTDTSGEFTAEINVSEPGKVVVFVHPNPQGWKVIDVQRDEHRGNPRLRRSCSRRMIRLVWTMRALIGI